MKNILMIYRTQVFEKEFLKSYEKFKDDNVTLLVENHRQVNVLNLIYGDMNIKIREMLDLTSGKMKEEKMKFDYIVGNPPYQYPKGLKDTGSKLYIKITNAAINLLKADGEISFITPQTIVTTNKNNILKSLNCITNIDYSVNRFFNIGVNVCSWTAKLGYSGNVKIVNMDGSLDTRAQGNYLEKTKLEALQIIESFWQKNKDKEKLFKTDSPNVSKIESENTYVMYTNYNAFKKDPSKGLIKCMKPKDYGKKKLVLSTTQSYKKDNIFISDKDFGHLQVYTIVDGMSDDEIESLKDYVMSPEFIGASDAYKKFTGTGFNNILGSIPKPKPKLNVKIKEQK